MNREIYTKIREFSIDMYTQGFSDGYTDGSTKGVEVEKAQEYKRGFENGYSQGWDEAYEKGLKDAWEVARKITNDLPIPELESRELSVDDCEDEYEYSCKVLKMYSASEAIAKFKEYGKKKCEKCTHKDDNFDCHDFCVPYGFDHFMEKQDDQNKLSDLGKCIKCMYYTKIGICNACRNNNKYEEKKSVDDEIRVGDEVIFDNNKYIVIFIPPIGFLHVLDENGKWVIIFEKNDAIKTGRHFPQIAEMLNQLKEENKE